jgi:hypothetical protein
MSAASPPSLLTTSRRTVNWLRREPPECVVLQLVQAYREHPAYQTRAMAERQDRHHRAVLLIALLAVVIPALREAADVALAGGTPSAQQRTRLAVTPAVSSVLLLLTVALGVTEPRLRRDRAAARTAPHGPAEVPMNAAPPA